MLFFNANFICYYFYPTKKREEPKIAALNKFLRIIYARIKELYDNMALAERAKAKTKSKTKAKTKATA